MMRLWFFCLLIFIANRAVSAEIKVCKTCQYKTPQSAIDAASNGDIIRISAGVYEAKNILVKKSVTIIGEGFPVFDAKFEEECMTILVPGVSVSGIEFKNTKRGNLRDFAAIRVFKTKRVKITGNKLKNTFFGVYLSDVDSALISGNALEGDSPDQTSGGNGIHLWQCSNVSILNNNISGHRDGIYFEFARNGTITGNTTTGNLRYGLHFMFSDSNVFRSNSFFKNGTGVAVMYSKRIYMFDNLFYENWGSAVYGMLLKDINDSRISGNIFEKNTAALYFEGSNRVKIDSNVFISNGWAIKLLASCQQDTFVHNNFKGNTFDVSTNGSLYLNYMGKNYWQKYEGYDINRDNVGDVPHRPVSLYTMMVEKMPHFILMLRSFIIDLLDTAERNIPGIIPENLIDGQPLMKEIPLDDRRRKT